MIVGGKLTRTVIHRQLTLVNTIHALVCSNNIQSLNASNLIFVCKHYIKGIYYDVEFLVVNINFWGENML
jgi:hypothetical protein